MILKFHQIDNLNEENELSEAKTLINENEFFAGDAETFRNDRRCRLAGIYMIEDNSNGKKYIGKARNILARILQHINAVNIPDDQTRGIDNLIAKNGWENFTYSILDYLPNADDDLLFSKEVDRIQEYNAGDSAFGYNLTQGNWKHTKEYIDRLNSDAEAEKADDAKFVTTKIIYLALEKLGLGKRFLMDKNILLFLKSDNSLYRSIHAWKELFDCTVKVVNSMEQLKGCYGMHFDVIIANPPYKKIGAEITKTIIDNIDFDDYINLLPINDYTRAEGLINHVEKAERLGFDAFAGQAAVDTWVAKIKKSAVHNYTNKNEFRLDFARMPEFSMFYRINARRKDRFWKWTYLKMFASEEEAQEYCNVNNIGPSNFFMVQWRASNGVNKNGGYDRQWNVDKQFSVRYSNEGPGGYFIGSSQGCKFNSELEKDNFTEFWYSNNGNNLMNKLLLGLRAQTHDVSGAIPQVDWSRPWTDEEILEEYGYSTSQINYILSDEFLYKVIGK